MAISESISSRAIAYDIIDKGHTHESVITEHPATHTSIYDKLEKETETSTTLLRQPLLEPNDTFIANQHANNKFSKLLFREDTTEFILWLVASLTAFVQNPFSLARALTLLHLLATRLPALQQVFQEKLSGKSTELDPVSRPLSVWRRQQSSSKDVNQENEQGLYMGIVLVPLLLSALANCDHSVELEHLAALAALTAWIAIHDWFVLFIILIIEANCAVALRSNDVEVDLEPFQLLLNWSSLAFLIVWTILYQFVYAETTPSLSSVFTMGEWMVVVNLTSVVITIFGNNLVQQFVHGNSFGAKSDLTACVAITGLLGSLIGCSIVARFMSNQSLLVKLIVLAVIPLVLVEATLWFVSTEDKSLSNIPLALFWLLDFMFQTEQPFFSQLHSVIPMIPRVAWIVYWQFVLAFTFLLAPDSKKTSTILARKWFHLVAILLFTPVLIASPQLLALAFAIASAVLMILECIRMDIPLLNDFYTKYLDTNKDVVSVVVNKNESKSVDVDSQAQDEKPQATNHYVVIISHMTLIVGCAAPLWMAEWLVNDLKNKGVDAKNMADFLLFLSSWGILSLGVGDSMGAVVGSTFGRCKWWGQNNKKTVEGSLAMLCSMALLCMLFIGNVNVAVWLPAVIFVTLLEAFTSQIDNLALPLVGVTVTLLCFARS